MSVPKSERFLCRKGCKEFLLLHAAGVAGAGLFLLFRGVTGRTIPLSFGCFLKEWFGIYCPLCGGTRAVDSLLHLRFADAFFSNAWVTVAAPIFLLWSAIGWIRLVKGKNPFLPIPKWGRVLLVATLALFFFARNLLLLRYGIDPLGDLLPA